MVRKRKMKRELPPGARELATETRRQRGIFNKYLKSLQGSVRRKLNDVEQELERGTRVKKVPLFKDKKRVGSVSKEVTLLPSDRAQLLARKRQLEEALKSAAPAELRKDFLAILPEYAQKSGFDRNVLIQVGVPEEDLDTAGILD